LTPGASQGDTPPVRVLVVTAVDSENSVAGPAARALEAAGHRAEVVEGKGGAVGQAALTARLAAARLVGRPDVALLELSPEGAAAAAALSAARVPYLVYASPALLGRGTGPGAELLQAALRVACQGARAILVPSDPVAEHLARAAGVEEMELLAAGLDLAQLPLGERAAARAALRLPEGMHVLGLVGPLDAGTHLEALGLAHRHVAGVALLVAGEGPAEGTLFAMAGTTRPSSPVIHVGPLTPATRVITACAADVTLALTEGRVADESWALAALGRRQVVFPAEGTDNVAALYPDQRTVFEAPPEPEGLRVVLQAALQEERAQGALPAAAVAAARAQLDAATRWARLAERVVECA
jgi:hypothetical protein